MFSGRLGLGRTLQLKKKETLGWLVDKGKTKSSRIICTRVPWTLNESHVRCAELLAGGEIEKEKKKRGGATALNLLEGRLRCRHGEKQAKKVPKLRNYSLRRRGSKGKGERDL